MFNKSAAQIAKELDPDRDGNVSGEELVNYTKKNPFTANSREVSTIIKDPERVASESVEEFAKLGLTLEEGAIDMVRSGILNGTIPIKPSGNAR